MNKLEIFQDYETDNFTNAKLLEDRVVNIPMKWGEIIGKSAIKNFNEDDII